MSARALHRCTILALALVAGAASAPAATGQSPPLAPSSLPPPPPPSMVPSRPSKAVSVQCADAGVSALLTAPCDVIEVGQELPFTLTITADKGVALSPIDLGESMGAFELHEADRKSVRDGERRVTTLQFVASTYLSGQLELAAIPIEFVSADGATHTLALEAVPVEVVSVVGAEFDPSVYRDIKGAVEIDIGGWIWWVTGTAVAVALALLVALAMRRRAAASLRVLRAEEWATRELQLLERDGLIERGDLHRFWVRLSGTLREYVERQFKIAAPEQTTKEFLAKAAAHPAIDGEHRQMLSRFLGAADMVKFAAHTPLVDECHKGLASAHEFVRETTPARTDESSPRGGSA